MRRLRQSSFRPAAQKSVDLHSAIAQPPGRKRFPIQPQPLLFARTHRRVAVSLPKYIVSDALPELLGSRATSGIQPRRSNRSIATVSVAREPRTPPTAEG